MQCISLYIFVSPLHGRPPEPGSAGGFCPLEWGERGGGSLSCFEVSLERSGRFLMDCAMCFGFETLLDAIQHFIVKGCQVDGCIDKRSMERSTMKIHNSVRSNTPVQILSPPDQASCTLNDLIAKQKQTLRKKNKNPKPFWRHCLAGRSCYCRISCRESIHHESAHVLFV